MCVVCRRRFAKGELARYVCGANGSGGRTLQPDPEQIEPGRGYYVCTDEQCRRRLHQGKGWQKKCRG
jgi:hypothetical protein